MLLFDVNVLIYAHRADLPLHAATKPWLEEQANASEPFGMSELVLSSFVRIVTNPRAFKTPTPLDLALRQVGALAARPNCIQVRPGPDHFALFTRLCQQADASGKLVADAYHAALAIEHGCRWITFDRDFSRFEELDWEMPDFVEAH